MARAVASDHDLELAIGSTLSDPEQKAELVDRLLGCRVGRRHARDHPAPRAEPARPPHRRAAALRGGDVAAASGGFVAIVTAAEPLADAQLEKLKTTLAGQYGSEPRIDLRIDPAVIGGLRVQVGDEVIDGTIASRITELRLQLAG